MNAQHRPLQLMAGWVPANARPGSAEDRVGEDISSAQVLIIEDEVVIAWMIEGLLEDMGFTSIAIAADGAEALRLVEARPPALIISDINLGGGPDGVQTVAEIRSRLVSPVIFVSGYASADARARIERLIDGARVLRKPIEQRHLRRAVVASLTPDKPQ